MAPDRQKSDCACVLRRRIGDESGTGRGRSGFGFDGDEDDDGDALGEPRALHAGAGVEGAEVGVREGVFASPEGDESAEGVRAVGVREDVGEMAEERARAPCVPHLLEAHAVDAGREAELAESRGDAPRAANKARGVARLAGKHAGEELHVPRQHAKRAATGTSGGPGDPPRRGSRPRGTPPSPPTPRRAKRLLRVGGSARASRMLVRRDERHARRHDVCDAPAHLRLARRPEADALASARRDLRESSARTVPWSKYFLRFARVGVGRYTS